MFTYVATGGLNAVGCSITTKTIFIRTKFKEGDVAYEERLARKGKLEKLVIKRKTFQLAGRASFQLAG